MEGTSPCGHGAKAFVSQYRIPARPEAIHHTLQEIMEKIQQVYVLDEYNYGRVYIALSEALSNAYRHGCQQQQHMTIFVQVELEVPHLRIRVRDFGPGFPYQQFLQKVESMSSEMPPELLDAPEGRGILLMRRLADQLTYACQGTEVTLYFHLYRKDGQ